MCLMNVSGTGHDTVRETVRGWTGLGWDRQPCGAWENLRQGRLFAEDVEEGVSAAHVFPGERFWLGVVFRCSF